MERILLFESGVAGHRLSYIDALLDYWVKEKFNRKGEITLVLSEKFFATHKNQLLQYEESHKSNIKFVSFKEDSVLKNHLFTQAQFKDWYVINKFIEDTKPSHCLCLNLDHFILPLGLRLPSQAVSFSGIYFKPSFHYKYISGVKLMTKMRIVGWVKKIFLKQAVRNNKLKNIFSLDPYAVPYINEFPPEAKAIYLPEPSNQTNGEGEQGFLREDLGIEGHRKVFLMFGVIKKRKGIHEFLQALHDLDPSASRDLCLLIIGPIKETEKSQILNAISEAKSKSEVQIIVRDQYVYAEDTQRYFGVCDVVLAVYPTHVGSSNIIIQACVAGKPILGSNFGVVGRTIKERKLGVIVDMESSKDINRGIKKILDNYEVSYDKECMQDFALINTRKNFAKTIFDKIFNHLPDGGFDLETNI